MTTEELLTLIEKNRLTNKWWNRLLGIKSKRKVTNNYQTYLDTPKHYVFDYVSRVKIDTYSYVFLTTKNNYVVIVPGRTSSDSVTVHKTALDAAALCDIYFPRKEIEVV